MLAFECCPSRVRKGKFLLMMVAIDKEEREVCLMMSGEECRLSPFFNYGYLEMTA
jgi:hypothetical protein